MLLTTHDLAKAYDNKLQVNMIVLDFSKVFDKVPHERLLHKLNHYGIGGETHNWICTFLTPKCQSVVLEGSYSSNVHVPSGVLQGTVLGPLVFLLYINDLSDCVSSTATSMTADDCTLQSDLVKVRHQTTTNGLHKWENKWVMHFVSVLNGKKLNSLPGLYQLCHHC